MSKYFSFNFRKQGLPLLKKHIILVALVGLFLWTYGFYTLGVSSVYRAYPELHATAQAKQILGKVGKLIELPSGTPTIIIIKDAASAKKSQPFLVKAKDGDVLIVYQKEGEAILYRYSADKLVTVGPIKSRLQSTKPSQTNARAVSQSSHIKTVPVSTSTNNATTTKSNK